MHLKPALITLILFACVSQRHFKSTLVPPGTVQINDTLFADKTEIGNVHWREYLYYLSGFKKDTIAYERALPDSSIWLFGDSSLSPFAEYYFHHPGFNNYPVVGISYEQVVEFCKWRTYVANQRIYFKENHIKDWKQHLNDTFPIKFYYRLPVKKEWEMIASGIYSAADHPYGYLDIYTKWRRKKYKTFNCDYSALEGKADTTRFFFTSSIKSYLKNSSDTYCMIGNVAEMVLEKGIAKGGSFIHSLDSCKISINQFYTKPEKWLGFRCVAVKKKII